MLACIPVIAAAELGVDSQRCEYRDNPLGIDVTKPRLSWVMEDVKSEVPNPKSETSGQKSEVRDQRSEVRDQRSEAGSRLPIRCWWSRRRNC